VPYGFDVVSIGIKHERAVVRGMVVSRAGPAVVPPTCTERRFVKAVNLRLISGLEREVGKRRWPVSTVDIEFIYVEVAISFAKRVQQIERLDCCSIEALACFEVSDTKVNMIEQASLVVSHDAPSKKPQLDFIRWRSPSRARKCLA
jgi:hypothetical protein